MSELDPSPSIEPPPVPVGQSRPRIWPCFVLLCVIIVVISIAQGIGISAMLGISMAKNGTTLAEVSGDLILKLTDPGWFILLGILAQLTCLFGAIFAARLSPAESTWKRLGFKRTGWPFWKLVVVTLGSIPAVAIGMGLAHLLAMVIPADPTAEMLYQNMTVAWALPYLLFIALAPGFAEEMLFRGYIQRRFLSRWKPWSAILLTSLIFGLFHVMPHTVIFAFVVGVWLGFVAWKAQSIWPTIVGHAFINGGWNLFNLSVRFQDINYSTQRLILGGLITIGIVAFFIAIRLLKDDTV